MPDATDRGLGVQDFILTPDDTAAINTLLAQMNAHIQQEAARRGFAYFALQSLYGRPDVKAPFNPIASMTSGQPYGQLISLDWVHPTAAGREFSPSLPRARAMTVITTVF
jgi:hypothetical protein